MTVLDRAQLAAMFLARWVDASEEPGTRLTKRVRKALALADQVLQEAATQPDGPVNPEPTVDCYHCHKPGPLSECMAIGGQWIHKAVCVADFTRSA